MRVVGGALRGRLFGKHVPKGTRPTSDRVREALASILLSRDAIESRLILDLFAGTGALSFEALSRGATSSVLVERDRAAARAIRRSAEALGLQDRCRVAARDIADAETQRHLARQGPFDLIFCDPPYAEIEAAHDSLKSLQNIGAFSSEAVLVIECAKADAERFPGKAYRYGDTSIVLCEDVSELVSE